MFLLAYKLRSDKLTDISYAVSFLVLAIYALASTSSPKALSLVIFFMSTLWSLRIGSFLLRRVLKVGKDKRFDEMRGHFLKFGKFWLGQALTAWLLMIPAELAIHSNRNIKFFVFIGMAVWAIGLIAESIADWQKFSFHERKTKTHPWIDEGIWKYSRHPNYFGEISVWLGIYIASFSALTVVQKLIGLISPVFITLLLLFVSGVPILEKSADERWGEDKDYVSYKERTRLIIPLPK